ncbi:aminopeptidase A [Thiogranum longum]|uniref:Probable cytosol aminopeptidase n=1 Tax=Thiogranum longum TaxID=1537524 RepID=A0A4R1HC52_9GAMM|nr:leucyl aminopeptidase [Thiogranum longum]TCK19008.1 aminopeptidase A [Thiogranum longum]
MDFNAKTGDADKLASSCVVVAVSSPRRLSAAATRLDKASRGQISTLIRQGDIDTGCGATTLIHNPAGRVKAKRILVVGCGKDKILSPQAFNKIASAAACAVQRSGATDAASWLTEIEVKDRDSCWKAQQLAAASEDAVYRFDELKSDPKPPKRPLRRLSVVSADGEELDTIREGIQAGAAVAHGMNLARTLGNRPGNYCTPSDLADQALSLKNDFPSLKVQVLEEKDMEKLGMGALLSVSRGSREPARLIVMQYNGGKKGDKPTVLVGKGVTFDSGGISLKPGAAMDEMKFDMCGAASVFGTVAAVVEMALPINLVGIVPSTENMPDGLATKPGDIVTSMSGQTIEVLNTDAEGRLILCDALTYAEKFNPDVVIDVATLTGACVIALGKHATGLFSNDQPLADKLLSAGQTTGDRAWQMPLWDEYDEQLSSNFADMGNIGGRDAGSITAACFLARYTKDYRWAHLDIAGVAWKSGKDKGATGRPVPLLTQFLMDRLHDAG